VSGASPRVLGPPLRPRLARLTPGRAALALGALVSLLLGACAPHLLAPPRLDGVARRAAYRAALATREALGGVEADLALWIQWVSAGDLPGAQARLVLGAPDAFRLRIESMFGTALDVSARGDSITAYLPSRRLGMAIDSARDSLGLREVGRLGYRAWSADWDPPDSAWSAAVWEDTLLVVRWAEEDDSLQLAVGSGGRPVWAVLARDGGPGIQASYPEWAVWEGVRWPSLIEFEVASGDLEVTCRIRRVRFREHPDGPALAVRLPARAERLTPSALKRALEKLPRL